MLVIGPNRVFLRYIEQVLPSLGEAGVEQVVLADLVPDVRLVGRGDADRQSGDGEGQGRCPHGRRDRQGGERPRASAAGGPRRAVPHRATCGCGPTTRSASSSRLGDASVATTRPGDGSRARSGRRWRDLARPTRSRRATSASEVRTLPEMREALERMWPVLTPAELLHDLFGSKALLKLAAVEVPREFEYMSLYRPRGATVADVRWTPPTWPCSTRPASSSAPGRRGGQGRTRTTRSARTGTSSSTRCRT